MSAGGWIGVDFDGTLARYEGWKGAAHLGEPVPAMLARVKTWIERGREVRIFTARVWPIPIVHVDVNPMDQLPEGKREQERLFEAALAAQMIQAWCLKHVGRKLAVTCQKDYGMIELWDDRCVAVEMNTGVVVSNGMSVRPL